jgi:hypothetical protein
MLGWEAGWKGEAREVGRPKRAERPRPELNLRGARKGNGFLGGSKPLKRRQKAEKFVGKAQERRGKRRLISDHLGGEKL